MARVKRGVTSHARHKKVLKKVKGQYGARSKLFKVAKDIDKSYKKSFDKALNNGVKVLCYDCKLNPEEIKINNEIKYAK